MTIGKNGLMQGKERGEKMTTVKSYCYCCHKITTWQKELPRGGWFCTDCRKRIDHVVIDEFLTEDKDNEKT